MSSNSPVLESPSSSEAIPKSCAVQTSGGSFEEQLRKAAHRPSKAKILLLVLAVTIFHELGNLALAWGLKHVSSVGVNPISYIAAMLNPFVSGGIVFLILWMLMRMALMSWADLSFALPLMAIGYVLATLLGKFVLHERVGDAQWMGTLLIFAGSAIVGTTTHRTHGTAGF